MSRPRVSILIPTLNAERDLEQLLPALAEQELEGGLEVRVIDSDSTDATRQILRAAGIPVTRIERSTFRHGATRNQLAREAEGEFCLFLSQDATPAGPGFVTALLAPFADERVAGATARVLPNPSDDPLTARTVLAAPEADDRSEVRAIASPAAFAEMDASERLRHLRFNNVASCIRADILREIPFPDLAFGEDSAWAARALTAGWKVAFVAEAVVHHAHEYGAAEAFERYRVDAAFHRRTHDYRVRPNLGSVVRGLLYEIREDYRFIRRHDASLVHLWRSPSLRGGQVLGQYFGSRGWRPGGKDAGSRPATRRFS